MKSPELLSAESAQNVKNSYFNILALFSRSSAVETRFVHCLLKWGFQLHLTPHDLVPGHRISEISRFQIPESKVGRMEAVYHLVYMIHLDDVVEDVELELASIYAQELGFSKETVPDVLKAIETAVYDDDRSHQEIRNEVLEFLKVNEL
jgi:hypothetical protein